jgi:hypothetical protein
VWELDQERGIVADPSAPFEHHLTFHALTEAGRMHHGLDPFMVECIFTGPKGDRMKERAVSGTSLDPVGRIAEDFRRFKAGREGK